MRLLLALAQLLDLTTLTSAIIFPQNKVGVIDPNGKITHDQSAPHWNMETPLYITCTPKAGTKCGGKAVTTAQCLQSCNGEWL